MARFGVIHFPGTAGNHISTDDVNLLDADTAHAWQGVGVWVNRFNPGGTTVEVDQAYGDKFGSIKASIAGANNFVGTDVAQRFPITPLATYSLRYEIEVEVSGSYRLDSQLYNGSGSVTQNNNVTVELTAGVVHVHEQTFTANSIAVTMAFYFNDINNLLNGTFVRIKNICFRQGSVATFVPSLRIVGDYEFNVRAIVNALPGANQYMWNMWSGTASQRLFNLHVNASDLFSFTANGTAALRSLASAIIGQAYDIRGTAVVGGVTELFIDTVSQGTNAGVTTATPSGPLVAGARSTGANNWEGDFFNANLQDGIGGPVVAALIPGEIPLPSGGNLDGASWTGGDGRTWQIHGNEVEIRTGGGLLGEYFMTDRRGNPRPKSSLTRKVRRA